MEMARLLLLILVSWRIIGRAKASRKSIKSYSRKKILKPDN